MGIFDDILESAMTAIDTVSSAMDDIGYDIRHPTPHEYTDEDMINDIVEDEFEDINDLKTYRLKGLYTTVETDGKVTCPKCGKVCDVNEKNAVHIDHIIPQSKGGSSDLANLQAVCEHCNESKQDDMSDCEADLARREEELNEQEEWSKQKLSDFVDLWDADTLT